MAVIAPAPIVLNNATVKFGTTSGNNYETSVSSISLVPTTPTSVFKGVGGNVIPIAGVPSWQANISYIQDPKTALSLQKYLADNAGTTQTLTFAPVAGTGNTSYTISVVIVPGQIGGDVDTLLTSSVTLDCVGQPASTVLP